MDGLRGDYAYKKRTAEPVKEAAAKTAEAAAERWPTSPTCSSRPSASAPAAPPSASSTRRPRRTTGSSWPTPNLVIENFTNQRTEGTATARLDGRFMGSGVTTVRATFRPETNGPDFDLNVAAREHGPQDAEQPAAGAREGRRRVGGVLGLLRGQREGGAHQGLRQAALRRPRRLRRRAGSREVVRGEAQGEGGGRGGEGAQEPAARRGRDRGADRGAGQESEGEHLGDRRRASCRTPSSRRSCRASSRSGRASDADRRCGRPAPAGRGTTSSGAATARSAIHATTSDAGQHGGRRDPVGHPEPAHDRQQEAAEHGQHEDEREQAEEQRQRTEEERGEHEDQRVGPAEVRGR